MNPPVLCARQPNCRRKDFEQVAAKDDCQKFSITTWLSESAKTSVTFATSVQGSAVAIVARDSQKKQHPDSEPRATAVEKLVQSSGVCLKDSCHGGNARFTNSGFSVCASSGRLKSHRMSTSRQTCCRGGGIPDFGRSNTGVSLAKPAETPETSPKQRTVRQNAPQVPKEIKRLIGIRTFTV